MFNPSRGRRIPELKASLDYKVSSKTAETQTNQTKGIILKAQSENQNRPIRFHLKGRASKTQSKSHLKDPGKRARVPVLAPQGVAAGRGGRHQPDTVCLDSS